MKVLLLGASGFIGKSIANHAPNHVNLTGTYCTNKPTAVKFETQKLDYLDANLDWEQLIQPYDCIVVAARASGATAAQRNEVARLGKISFKGLIDAVKARSTPPHLVAMHGSLTYGDMGEALVNTNAPVRPSGFASSYSLAESPFREHQKQGGSIAIVRAPWVIGAFSWYRRLYATSPTIPLIGHGNQWMSLVSVDELATYVWKLAEERASGIIHPPLTYRCRQREFVKMVQTVSGKDIKRMRWWTLRRMEKQMRTSILASIRLDDGNSMGSEGEQARKTMQRYLEDLHRGFS